MNTVLDDKEKREGVVTQPGVVAPGVLAQPQQPANVFSGKRPTTFENMPVNVGWTPYGKPVNEGSNVQQSWQTSNPSNMEGSMPSSYALNSKPLGVDATSAPVFEKDDSQRDGGFFKWLGGLSKKRPGRREGESDDDYDERMTRNNMRIATLADAIRHMGNIYNTSKGAALQKFNSPTAEMQADLDKRKAERARKAAAEADAAYKNANLQIKMDAADADRAYKGQMLDLKRSADKRADQNAKDLKTYRDGILGVQQGNLKLAGERADETKRHNKANEGLIARRLALAMIREAREASGSGGNGGGFSSVTNLSTPNGHMNRKKDLNAIEKKQLKDYLYKNGFITKSAAKKYEGALSDQERGAILNSWIGWAANAKGTKADKFRKALTDHYGYVETKTVSSNNTPAKSNPIRWQGSGSKPKTKAKSGTSNSKGTDWSQYVK